MGGSSKSQPLPKPVVPVDNGYYDVTPIARTIQPLVPGHLDRVAAQMTRGYGGTPQTYRDQMNAVYRPLDIPDYPAAHRARDAARVAVVEQAPALAVSAPTAAPTRISSVFVHDPGNWRGGPY